MVFFISKIAFPLAFLIKQCIFEIRLQKLKTVYNFPNGGS